VEVFLSVVTASYASRHVPFSLSFSFVCDLFSPHTRKTHESHVSDTAEIGQERDRKRRALKAYFHYSTHDFKLRKVWLGHCNIIKMSIEATRYG